MHDRFAGLLSDRALSSFDAVSSLARAVEFGELALQGHDAAVGAVRHEVSGAVLVLAALIIGYSDVLGESDHDGGILLWEGAVGPDAAAASHRVRLMTKIDMFPCLLAVLEGTELVARAMFDDGHGPQPGVHLDGLLRLLEEWANELVKSEDYNWGDGVNGDVPHPEESLARSRQIRRRAADLAVVAGVMTS